jgi:hypothetical protein
MTDIDLDKIVNGYLQCALFTGVTEDDEPMDYVYNIGDFSEEAVEQATVECALFVQSNLDDVRELLDSHGGVDNEDIGMDLWYTRNGHGCGFWDRGYGELGDRLTEYCHTIPERSVVAGDGNEFELGDTLVIE